MSGHCKRVESELVGFSEGGNQEKWERNCQSHNITNFSRIEGQEHPEWKDHPMPRTVMKKDLQENKVIILNFRIWAMKRLGKIPERPCRSREWPRMQWASRKQHDKLRGQWKNNFKVLGKKMTFTLKFCMCELKILTDHNRKSKTISKMDESKYCRKDLIFQNM